MAVSFAFIKERLLATHSAQAALAVEWVSDEWPVQFWREELAVLQVQEEKVSRARAAMTAAQGDRDVAFAELHERTVTLLGVLKATHRRAPVFAGCLQPLTARGDSLAGILEEALELAATWGTVDAAWQLTPEETLEKFNAARAECGLLQKRFVNVRTLWRGEVGELNERARLLHRDCVAWYNVATTLYAEKTALGQMIRELVPTTYQVGREKSGEL